MLEQSEAGREVISAVHRSALDVLNDWFESDEVKIHFMKYTSKATINLEDKGNGIILFLLAGAINTHYALREQYATGRA